MAGVSGRTSIAYFYCARRVELRKLTLVAKTSEKRVSRAQGHLGSSNWSNRAYATSYYWWLIVGLMSTVSRTVS